MAIEKVRILQIDYAEYLCPEELVGPAFTVLNQLVKIESNWKPGTYQAREVPTTLSLTTKEYNFVEEFTKETE